MKPYKNLQELLDDAKTKFKDDEMKEEIESIMNIDNPFESMLHIKKMQEKMV